MRKRNWSECRITDGSEIRIDECIFSKLMGVVESQTHNEVMRMLCVHQRNAIGRFAGLEEQWIAAVRNGSWFEAEHEIGLEASF